MGSPFRSALAKLDDDVQNLEYQLSCLRGGLDVSDDQLWQALNEANQSTAALRNLILAERPDADWNDRSSLEILIQHLEWEAQARRDEERRKRLFELAGELDAGSIKHRFESRIATLNSLRLQAIRELRIAGTLYEQEKELPGPPAGEWVHWVCNLREENDGTVFEHLRRDFPALERFAGEMEESYWVCGHREHGAAAQPAVIPAEVQRTPQSIASTASAGTPEAASRSERAPSEPAIRMSEVAPVAAVATRTRVLDNASERSNGDGAVGTLHARSTVKATTAAYSADHPSSDSVESVPANDSMADLLPSFGAVAEIKRPVAVWISAGVILLLGVVFAGTYYVNSGSGGKSKDVVAHAAANAAGSPGSQISGSNPATPGQQTPTGANTGAAAGASGIAIQPIEGAQRQILLNMESCRRSNLESIECQGYVTNLSNEPSHVTLGGVDVVDGKGNSFNLNSSGQFNFSTGRSLSIAAGSREKYTVKVPDKDRDARTLTVYVDISNPHGLEFTFRNVPIAE
jgi:hypothetical protein